jgi:hypothetical protein
MFLCTVAAIAASGWYMNDRFSPFPAVVLFVHMAVVTALWLALAYVVADRSLLAESGITPAKWVLLLGIVTLMASFFGLMALNAGLDASPGVLHVQRVVGKERRLFLRPRGDVDHDPLVVESWHLPGGLQEVIVPSALWRKARVTRSYLEIETRHGWLGYEYLTREPVLVPAP